VLIFQIHGVITISKISMLIWVDESGFLNVYCMQVTGMLFNIHIKIQENMNCTKTDSSSCVENTLMRNNNIEGTRQINLVTSG